ncbi:ComF family protein [Rhodococcus erythropolis]|uniref:ComF family protein n=1 Tax=Rhodococcus erythropolis TaxID=1833 RepID=UPI0008785861|nr:hypothetical protein [Rhodococcus erythropolis]
MYLQTDPLPLTHIKECFGDSYAIVRGSPEWTSEYNRCLEFVDGFPKSFKNFVQLLSEVLCLPADEPFDLAFALDRYKVPEEDVHPTDWANTEVGDLVYRSKYFTSSPALQAAAREALAGKLAEAIRRHPSYHAAPYIVSVPGSSGDGTSTGESIARQVAGLTAKRLIQTIGPARPARKANPGLDVRGMFHLPAMLDGPCIVLDDVWMSGTTIREVGRVARHGGASHVYGLAAARTMRN